MTTAIEEGTWWGSDAIVDTLHAVGIDFVALNPGSSFRGLHDSLVNPPSGSGPRILLCLHEEHAVAIAHGYAKVTGKPMGVALHSNVGLMHATMALFNAYCDRVPMVVLGAQGPMAADARRPWIDWLHTTADLGALVRPYVKWDDAPMSVSASTESVTRAWQLTSSPPHAPTYVCFDALVQEERIEPPAPVDIERYGPFPAPGVTPEISDRVARLLSDARSPVILAGRVGRDHDAWQRRVELAERLGARVITSLRAGAAFPTSHPAHVGTVTGLGMSEPAAQALREADAVLALEWVDLGGTLAMAYGSAAVGATVVAVTLEQQLLSGWTKLDFSLAPIDVKVPSTPDVLVEAVLRRIGVDARPAPTSDSPNDVATVPPAAPTGEELTVADIQRELWEATHGRATSLLRVPFAWQPSLWPMETALDQLGGDGGGGIGSGPGMCVGGALALRGTDRLPVGILGDGDFLMGSSAVWTAAESNIPLLLIVANNRSFLNDERHQQIMARERGRPVEHAHVGIATAQPAPDLAGVARSLGWVGHGPVCSVEALREALSLAVEAVAGGQRVLVDVHVAKE